LQNDSGEASGRKDKKTASGKSTRNNESSSASTKRGEAKPALVATDGNLKGALLNWCSKKTYKALFSTANDGTAARPCLLEPLNLFF
jgi:hypothetical protein